MPKAKSPDNPATQTPNKDNFSGTFIIQNGEALALKADLAEQLAGLDGKSYLDIRHEFDIKVTSTRDSNGESTGYELTSDGFAIISIVGPITRYDNLCSWLFGGVSTQKLMEQIVQAESDPKCVGILLNIDSPGGQAAGTYDLGDMIYTCDKPVVAYIDNMAASGAYWIASACDRIVMSPAAFVGSIGVVTGFYKPKDTGYVELVSSKSPKKRPDLGSDEGRQQIQNCIDKLADIFINTVAKHRSVDASVVETDFGQGDIMIGEEAVSFKMADMLGSLDDALSELQRLQDRSITDTSRFGLSPNTTSKGENQMADTKTETPPVLTAEELLAQHPDAARTLQETARAEGATAERERINSIRKIDSPQNRAIAGDVIEAAYGDGKTDAKDLAYQILQAQEGKKITVAESRREDAAKIPAVTDAPDAKAADAPEAIAAGIAAYANAGKPDPKK